MRKFIVIRKGDINSNLIDSVSYNSKFKVVLIFISNNKISIFRSTNVRKLKLSKNFLKILTFEQNKEEHWFYIESIKLIILRGDFSEGM